jgi:hypothetical protein
MDDEELYEKGYDRVYDTLELEQSLDDIEKTVRSVLDGMPPGQAFSSADLHDRMGAWLDAHVEAPERPDPPAALPLRRAPVPRARPLGGPVGPHVLGGGLLGEVRAWRDGSLGRDTDADLARSAPRKG